MANCISDRFHFRMSGDIIVGPRCLHSFTYNNAIFDYYRTYRRVTCLGSLLGQYAATLNKFFVLFQVRKLLISGFYITEVMQLPLPNIPIYFMIGDKVEVPPDRRSQDYDHPTFFEIRTNVNIERWKKIIDLSSRGGMLWCLSKSGHCLQ
jgi:hypothetical protein